MQELLTYFSIGLGVGISIRLICVVLGGFQQFIKSVVNAIM